MQEPPRTTDRVTDMDRVRMARWRIEAVLAALFAVAALITAIFPQWIEAFGFEPDGGDGSAEWAIVFALGVATLASTALARSHYVRRPRRLSFEEGSPP
jgi:hypothetical protein